MRELSKPLIAGGNVQSFLPVAAVYGPNAGGKSNLLDALMYVCGAVARPIIILKRGDNPADSMPRIRRCAPFAFDEASTGEPSRFEVDFRTSEHE